MVSFNSWATATYQLTQVEKINNWNSAPRQYHYIIADSSYKVPELEIRGEKTHLLVVTSSLANSSPAYSSPAYWIAAHMD